MALSGSGQRAKVGAKLEGGRAKDPYMGCHKRCEEGQKKEMSRAELCKGFSNFFSIPFLRLILGVVFSRCLSPPLLAAVLRPV